MTWDPTLAGRGIGEAARQFHRHRPSVIRGTPWGAGYCPVIRPSCAAGLGCLVSKSKEQDLTEGRAESGFAPRQ